MPGIATPLVRVSGTPKPKPAKASRSISGWPKSNPRTMLTTPPGKRTGTETGIVTAVPMRRPGDWSPTTRGPARIAPARRWPPSPRATPVDAPPRRPPCMFATATDRPGRGRPHPKHLDILPALKGRGFQLRDPEGSVLKVGVRGVAAGPADEARLALARLRRGVPAGLSLIHISEPTRLGMISYAVF